MRMKTKSDPTPKAKPIGEFWRGEGNRKRPSITLPRIRALETPEPTGKGDPKAAH